MNIILSLLLFISSGSNLFLNDESTTALQNPILPGYFADPSLVQHEGKFYLYVTADPWGEDFLSCWESSDFRDWTFHTLNWPTKAACTSPTSRTNKVWAPSVIKRNGKFYMYVSVGSEVWCGIADHPLGPWKNSLGTQPMISDDPTGKCHVIDAEVFVDNNNRAYLYWGSGWNWTNGHCMVAELNDNMNTFKTTPKEVTPTHYFEAPYMIKRNNSYFLTYSEGKTIDETYEVRYAVGDNPFGPFTEATNSPILTTNDSLQVFGPGHHTMVELNNKDYILYHRHRSPFEKGSAYRQVCINEFAFNHTGNGINTIIPWHTQSLPFVKKNKLTAIRPLNLTASSQSFPYTQVNYMMDNSYATRWEAAEKDPVPSLTATFDNNTKLEKMEIRFEYPWKKYFPKIEILTTKGKWKVIADYTENGISGSPVNVSIGEKTTTVKVSFLKKSNTATPSIWELRFLKK